MPKIVTVYTDFDSAMYDADGARFPVREATYVFLVEDDEKFLGYLQNNTFNMSQKFYMNLMDHFEWEYKSMQKPAYCDMSWLSKLDVGEHDFGNYNITVIDIENAITIK